MKLYFDILLKSLLKILRFGLPWVLQGVRRGPNPTLRHQTCVTIWSPPEDDKIWASSKPPIGSDIL